MSQDFDDLLTNTQEKQNSQPKGAALEPYDKDAYIEKKQAEREEAFHKADVTAERAASSADAYAVYLNVQARFNRYSVNNALLIADQMPDATRLATFDEWRENNVKIEPGAKAIMLLTPGKEFERDDGSVGASFNVKKVFDISQTNAIRRQAEIHRDQRLVMKALVSNPPCRLAVEDSRVPANSVAFYNTTEKTIFVRHGRGFDELFRALARELAFAHLDNGGEFSRNNCEFKAKSIAYLVCARNHIAPDSVAFPSSYSNQEAKVIKAELNQIRDVANTMHNTMENVLGKQKEQNHSGPVNPKNRDAR